MPRYIRRRVDGGTYFFTIVLMNRGSRLLLEHVELLRTAFRHVRARRPFDIDAIVILPDHLHCIWTLPTGDHDYSTRWRLIKHYFSRALPSGESRSRSRTRRGERGLWQRRFWEHTIRDENDFDRHVEYIHYNPVKHGYVDRPIDWPYSSFHRYVSRGIYPATWCTCPMHQSVEGESP